MSIILLVLLIAYQTIAALTDMRDVKKLTGKEVTEKMRLAFYKEAMIWGWIPVGIIFLFVAFSSWSLQDVGLRKITFSSSILLNTIVFVITAAVVIALLYQTMMYFISEKYRKEMAVELQSKKDNKNHYDYVVLNLLLPRTLKQKKYFFFVSLTAGICEEIHLRGCIMFLLADIFPNMHIAFIALIAAALFGIFHCYQGVHGMIKTGIGGLFFAALYIATDSLILGILLHFCMDFSSAFIIKEE